jgi:hypothetical protein
MGWLITRLAQATSVYTDDVWVADSSRSSALGPARQCTAPIWQDTPSTATAPPTPVTFGMPAAAGGHTPRPARGVALTRRVVSAKVLPK